MVPTPCFGCRMATDGNAVVPSPKAPAEPNPGAPEAPPTAPTSVGISVEAN
ncbi:hypothetical protein RchiOBHm_Chr5g0054121 [Rosa chinensis]|uniref:Uncharacterized protein n=1 Tax=Rosa chinensis TaxID=74649 RepID=A0A2P6QG33_ROSCH|nr:hypothetical protein RchiOBHm_Chr5g0054121 [Rosa chinensis]